MSKWKRRETKRKKKREMKIDSKSVFVIEQELGKRATKARRGEQARKNN